MLFTNGGINEPMGVVNNPLINTPFVFNTNEGGSPLPPTSSFIVTDPLGDDYIITEDGMKMITE